MITLIDNVMGVNAIVLPNGQPIKEGKDKFVPMLN
jgi:hypothetical protein